MLIGVKQELSGSGDQFQPHQIVCLEHERTCLYNEVIEVVPSRQVCWVRPLMLVVFPIHLDALPVFSPEQLSLYDLRQGSDLLWPTHFFRVALDTEVIPLLMQLDNPDSALTANNSEAHKQLSCFVRKVWQAYKSAFQAS